MTFILLYNFGEILHLQRKSTSFGNDNKEVFGDEFLYFILSFNFKFAKLIQYKQLSYNYLSNSKVKDEGPIRLNTDEMKRFDKQLYKHDGYI